MIYLGTNRAKHIQDTFTENGQMPMKEMKEGLKKWRDLQHSPLKELNIKMSLLPRLIDNFYYSSYQNHKGFYIQ